MRQLLVTILLLITVIALYESVAEGDEGLNARVRGAGEAVHGYLEGMSP